MGKFFAFIVSENGSICGGAIAAPAAERFELTHAAIPASIMVMAMPIKLTLRILTLRMLYRPTNSVPNGTQCENLCQVRKAASNPVIRTGLTMYRSVHYIVHCGAPLLW